MQTFLAQCARIHGGAAYHQRLARQATAASEWTNLAKQAETHGLGPLLYKHLRAAEIRLPPTTKEELQGLYLRHRRANRVRMEVLVDILAVLQEAGIEAIVLKGAALANLIYPEPGLRPMRDMDLLVNPPQAHQAHGLLAKAGFEGPSSSRRKLPDKHLSALGIKTAGFWVNVEIHHNLFNEDFPASLTTEALTSPLLPFSLNGATAYTLGYEDMLWHLCQHVAYHANVWEQLRFIWLADIVGFAEQFATKIDWGRIERNYPLILKTLALFHFATPLSETLQAIAPLKIGRPPGGIGQDFAGWPRSSWTRLRVRGYGRVLLDTFCPPEWWLRLRYQLGSTESLFWYRWACHPLYILSRVKQLTSERLF